MSRLPTALTSSMLPALTLTFWLPGSMTFSGSTPAAGVSPPTGVVPGAGALEDVAGGVPPPVGVVPGAGCLAGVVDAGVSAPTGLVPGWAVDVLGGAVLGGAVLAGVAPDGVFCAHNPVASANAASVAALELMREALMT
jgi:hypothetical protein